MPASTQATCPNRLKTTRRGSARPSRIWPLFCNATAVIRFSDLTLIRGTNPLLERADVSLNPGERVGLIGANGSGKSSLFALLRGELHADKGDADFPAHWRVAHVAQETPALERPAVEY